MAPLEFHPVGKLFLLTPAVERYTAVGALSDVPNVIYNTLEEPTPPLFLTKMDTRSLGYGQEYVVYCMQKPPRELGTMDLSSTDTVDMASQNFTVYIEKLLLIGPGGPWTPRSPLIPWSPWRPRSPLEPGGPGTP